MRHEFDSFQEALYEAQYKAETTGNVVVVKRALNGRWEITYDMSDQYAECRVPLYEIIERELSEDQAEVEDQQRCEAAAEHEAINETYYARQRRENGSDHPHDDESSYASHTASGLMPD